MVFSLSIHLFLRVSTFVSQNIRLIFPKHPPDSSLGILLVLPKRPRLLSATTSFYSCQTRKTRFAHRPQRLMVLETTTTMQLEP